MAVSGEVTDLVEETSSHLDRTDLPYESRSSHARVSYCYRSAINQPSRFELTGFALDDHIGGKYVFVVFLLLFL
jgi:hypothetical protein